MKTIKDNRRMETEMITARELKGIIPPIVTPITEADEVDVKAVGKIVEYELEGGVAGIFVCGSSGEFPAMTFEDRRVVTRATVEAVKGRVPVLAGCAATGLREVIQHAKVAAALGAAAVVVTAPYYFSYTPAEIVEFFRRVAKASPVPVVAYNIPSTTKVSLSVSTILQISEIKGVIGLKDSSGDIGPYGEILTGLRGREDFALFQGAERVAAVSLMMGGAGCVLGLANVLPRLCVDLYEAAKAGQVQRALDMQEKVNDLFNIFRVMEPSFSSVSTVIGAMKAPLEILGLGSRRPYPPARAATEEEVGRIGEIVKRARGK